MTPETSPPWKQAKRDKRPVVLATRLPDGEQRLLPDPDAPAELNEAAARALDRDESGTVKLGDTDWFLHAYNPPLRLIVVGAVHIAQALVPFAVAMRLRGHRGRSAPLLRLGRAVSQRHRSPPTGRTRRWTPSRPDSRTAVVTLTHDPKLDDPGAGPRAEIAGVLHRRPRLPPHPCRAAEATARTGPSGQRPVPHPRPGRPEHRGRHRAGNRPVHHRRDRRRPPQRAACRRSPLA